MTDDQRDDEAAWKFVRHRFAGVTRPIRSSRRRERVLLRMLASRQKKKRESRAIHPFARGCWNHLHRVPRGPDDDIETFESNEE